MACGVGFGEGAGGGRGVWNREGGAGVERGGEVGMLFVLVMRAAKA